MGILLIISVVVNVILLTLIRGAVAESIANAKEVDGLKKEIIELKRWKMVKSYRNITRHHAHR